MSTPALVPKKVWPYFLFLFLGTGGVALLEYLYWIMPTLSEKLNLETLPWIDLSQRGNLCSWLQAIFWGCAATVSLAAFRIGRSNRELMRRNRALSEEREKAEQGENESNHLFSHARPATRKGSFSGASDIWLWAVFCCLFLSADSISHLRELIRVLGVTFGGTELYAQGHLWWVGIYVLIFGMIGSRLLVEMRHHLISCNAFFLGVLLHVLHCSLVLQLVSFPDHPRETIMLASALETLGTMFLVLAFSLYARRMLLLGIALETTHENLKRLSAADVTKTAAATPDEESVTKTSAEEKPESEGEDAELKTATRSSKSSKSSRSRSLHIVHPSSQGVKEVQLDEEEEDEEEEDDRPPRRRRSRPKTTRPRKSKRAKEPVFYELDDDEFEDEEQYEEAEYEQYEEESEEEYEEDDEERYEDEEDDYEPPRRRPKKRPKRSRRRYEE